MNDVVQGFLFKMRIKIIRDKYAFLLSELLEGIAVMSEEHGLPVPVITNTRTLKREILEEFPEEMSFFPKGKYLIVNASDINPCKYAVNILHGCGLRDGDIVRSFSRLIKKKITNRGEISYPITPEEFEEALKSGSLPALYSAIYHTVREGGKENEFGYMDTSSNSLATKIWSTATDWESLISRKPSPKQIVVGTIIHRMSGSKNAIKLLSKCNHVISYNKIQIRNKVWSYLGSSRIFLFPNMRKDVSTHSTVDNTNGKQETLTGEGATHDTTQTLFQLPTEKEREETVPICLQNETSLNVHGTIDCVDLFNIDEDHLHYDAGTRAEPPLFPDTRDDENSRSEIDFCLKKDIIWSLAGSISGSIAGSELPKLGSWTSFNRMVSNTKSLPCIQEYLPVTPHPPHYPICKQYLDFMLQVIEDLDIPFIFLHSDEDI